MWKGLRSMFQTNQMLQRNAFSVVQFTLRAVFEGEGDATKGSGPGRERKRDGGGEGD